jgi:hypothetical protein
MANSKGVAVGFSVLGGVFLIGGITGRSPLLVIQALIKGDKPTSAPVQYGINTAYYTPGSAPSTSVIPSGTSNTANQALGRSMAALYGWSTGAEWTALNNIVMAESGWSDTIKNPSSDASGIAQNINGFGPGYQEGNAAQQIAWLLSYIKGRYGDPVAAWQFHMANGYY